VTVEVVMPSYELFLTKLSVWEKGRQKETDRGTREGVSVLSDSQLLCNSLDTMWGPVVELKSQQLERGKPQFTTAKHGTVLW